MAQRAEPIISVGILEARTVRLTLAGQFCVEDNGKTIGGDAVAHAEGDGVALETANGVIVHAREIVVSPVGQTQGTFVLHDVLIGKEFHWEQSQSQTFSGGLSLMRSGENVIAVNDVGLETYLESVVSSEMSPAGAKEFLKAHAITSRSWLIAQITHSRGVKDGAIVRTPSVQREPGRLIRWYDREDHERFDVCADDHCQRYQGVGAVASSAAAQSVRETRGLVLMDGDEVCDARFSKSCGGVSELFENAWGPEHHAYLVPVRDAPGEKLPDLTGADAARRWIQGAEKAFCNLADRSIIEKILPRIDQNLGSLFRWTVSYTQEDLAALLASKSGIDFGAIRALVPKRRGTSGRIVELMVEGELTSLTVGKELEIRRLLSPAHLYSSAFVVDTEGMRDDVPELFVLHGAGWGHGVGLCQIGAGVMGENGYPCDAILGHYFSGAKIVQYYE